MKNDAVWQDAVVVRVDDAAEGVRRLEFAATEPFPAFDPGSHVQFRVAIGSSWATRSYSCLPDAAQGHVAVAVKLHPNSRGGSRHMFSLRPGDKIRLTTPANRFELSWRAPSYLLLAGGIGITPIYGMALALAAKGAKVRLAYGGPSLAAMPFVGPLRAILGDDLGLYPQDQGSMIDLAAEIARLPADGELYVCGPLPMLDAVRQAWQAAGRPLTRLRYEVFGDTGRFAEASFQVKVAGYGMDITVPPDQSMLDALIDAGVAMIHDCRRGECGMCAVDVLESHGDLDHRDVFFSDTEKREGKRMCACVSRLPGGCVTVDTGYRP